MNNVFDQYEVWFVTGAQLLYGGDAVIAVDAHSNEMVNGLNESGKLPVKVVYKGTANSSKEVEAVFKAANNDDKCVGVITWMHTFSPAKMWIHGATIKETIAAPAYSIQQGNLGYNGYGLYESEPVSSRRPRVRTYLYPYAHPSQSSGRLLERRRNIA